jgi:hypothetical protein
MSLKKLQFGKRRKNYISKLQALGAFFRIDVVH